MAKVIIDISEKNPSKELLYTEDKFVNGRVTIKQPVRGYRAGCDAVFLAASVSPKPYMRVLDLGAGVGVVSLILAKRYPDVSIVALENQPDLIQLARANVFDNQLLDQVEVISQTSSSPLTAGTFDYVVTNPPYYKRDCSKSPNILKAVSNTESMELENWVKFCFKMLKPNGILSMIHRPSRLSDILNVFKNRFGDVIIYPLWNVEDANRVIIKGKKGSRGTIKLLAGMTVHHPDGQFTKKSQEILREGKELNI